MLLSRSKRRRKCSISRYYDKARACARKAARRNAPRQDVSVWRAALARRAQRAAVPRDAGVWVFLSRASARAARITDGHRADPKRQHRPQSKVSADVACCIGTNRPQGLAFRPDRREERGKSRPQAWCGRARAGRGTRGIALQVTGITHSSAVRTGKGRTRRAGDGQGACGHS